VSFSASQPRQGFGAGVVLQEEGQPLSVLGPRCRARRGGSTVGSPPGFRDRTARSELGTRVFQAGCHGDRAPSRPLVGDARGVDEFGERVVQAYREHVNRQPQQVLRARIMTYVRSCARWPAQATTCSESSLSSRSRRRCKTSSQIFRSSGTASRFQLYKMLDDRDSCSRRPVRSSRIRTIGVIYWPSVPLTTTCCVSEGAFVLAVRIWRHWSSSPTPCRTTVFRFFGTQATPGDLSSRSLV